MSCSKPADPSNRVCAFCLNLLTKVLQCGKCKRRAYCSKECQKADWTVRKVPSESPTAIAFGQGHKHWCSLQCGEEGIDWAVEKVGDFHEIFALRDLPTYYRIIVEGSQFMDVDAKTGSLKQKGLADHPGMQALTGPKPTRPGNFTLFKVQCYRLHGKGIVSLRIALARNECTGNANILADPDFNVQILYARRPIQAGEEIRYPFEPFDNPTKSLPNLKERTSSLMRSFVVCPSSCACRDMKLRAKLEKMSMLVRTFLGGFGAQNDVLEKMRKAVEIGEAIGLPVDVMSRLYMNFGEVFYRRRSTADEGVQYIRKGLEFWESVLHPESDVVKMKEWANNPESYPDFGVWD